MATELLGTVLKDTAGLKAGDVVYAKKQKDGWTVTRKGDKKMDVQLEDGKSFQEFPVVDPAEDPARNLNSIEIVPMQWFLRQCWFNDKAKSWPNGMAGTHFADPSIAECVPREVIVPPCKDNEDIYMHTKELSRSIKLVLDGDHGYSGTFQPSGDKDIPHTGAEMGPQLMGVYAEKTTGERDPKTGKLKVTGDVFIPLSAIVRDPEIYCDRSKFPRFFDHSPNVVNLKAALAKPIARSEDKAKDYADGFKTYIAQLRFLTFKFGAILIIVHTVMAALYGVSVATLFAVPLAYILSSAWTKTKKQLKHLWTEQYPIYREYWRFKKDDEVARQFNYNFPFFANHPLLRQVLGKLFPTGNGSQMSSDHLPPDITHENKGMSGDKEGDRRLQYATFGLVFFYLAHYTPVIGFAVERSAAVFFLVMPVVVERGTELLADTSDAVETFYERYGLDYYKHQLVDMASAVPVHGRRTARIWTRKVLYGDIWRKNRAALELPEVGDETYEAVMPELFSICEEEYGFQHKDERVCKAMFKRTEDKHVENVEHFFFLALLVLLPALALTPKENRSSRFFITLPIAFFASFILVPHELRNSLIYFGDIGFVNSSSSRY